jgi:hypothetical protein
MPQLCAVWRSLRGTAGLIHIEGVAGEFFAWTTAISSGENNAAAVFDKLDHSTPADGIASRETMSSKARNENKT